MEKIISKELISADIKKLIERGIKEDTEDNIISIYNTIIDYIDSTGENMDKEMEQLLTFYSFINPQEASGCREDYAYNVLYTGKSDITYQEIIDILTSDDVRNQIIAREEDIFCLLPEIRLLKGFRTKLPLSAYDEYEHTLRMLENTENNKCLRIATLFQGTGKPRVYKTGYLGEEYLSNYTSASVDAFVNNSDYFNLNNKEIKLIKGLIRYSNWNPQFYLGVEKNKAMLQEIGKENLPLLYQLIKANLIVQSQDTLDLIPKIEKSAKIYQK